MQQEATGVKRVALARPAAGAPRAAFRNAMLARPSGGFPGRWAARWLCLKHELPKVRLLGKADTILAS
jgi:hypothetical protein